MGSRASFVDVLSMDAASGTWTRLEARLELTTNSEGWLEGVPTTGGPWIYVARHPEYVHPFVTWLRTPMAPTDLEGVLDREWILRAAREHRVVQEAVRGTTRFDRLVMKRGEPTTYRAVAPNGQPCPGVHLYAVTNSDSRMLAFCLATALPELFERLGTTGSDGRLTLRCFEASTPPWAVLPVHPRYVAKPRPGSSESGSAEVSFTMMEPASVVGRVLGPTGEPAVDAVVSTAGFAVGPDGQLEVGIEVEAREDGSFELLRVPPGDAKVRAQHPVWNSRSVELSGLQPGEQRSGVVLQLEARGVVHGVLQDEFGQPLANERVVASRAAGGVPWTDHGETDESGVFVLDVKSDVPVDLWIQTENRRTALQRGVHPSAQALRLVAEATPRTLLPVELGGGVRYTARSVEPYDYGLLSSRAGPDQRALVPLLGPPPFYIVIAPYYRRVDKMGWFESFVVKIPRLPEPDEQLVGSIVDARPIFGVIHDEAGHPVPDAELRVTIRGHERRVPIDTSGAFEIAPYRHEGARFSSFELNLPEGLATHGLDEGLAIDAFNRIVVVGRRNDLRGRVLLQQGEETTVVGGCPLQVHWREPHAPDVERTYAFQSAWSGAFRVDALPKGTELRLDVDPAFLSEKGYEHVGGSLTAKAEDKDVVLVIRRSR